MFKNGKAQPEKASPDVTVINRGTTVEGEIKVAGTIRIYGRLNGTVHSEGKVIVAEDGVLSGDLRAGAADVSGTVEGVIEADRLDLRSTATVEGNVVVKKFTTETGAVFIGDCQMPQHDALPAAPSHGGASGDGAPPEVDAGSEEEAAEQKASKEEADDAEESEDGGIKPLPNKPDEAEPEAEAADASDGEGRPRFW